VLREAAAAVAPPLLRADRYRETRSVGMVVCSDRTGNGARLAGLLHEALAQLGVYEPERRPWLPHVTVLRFRERPRLSPPPPELPEFAPSGAAAFLSRLHPSGARYTAPDYIVLESFELGG
jgi:2'-5' RNA ligase